MYEPEDEAGWAALPALSDEHAATLSSDCIGPLPSSGNATYTHKLHSHTDRTVQLASQPDQVNMHTLL